MVCAIGRMNLTDFVPIRFCMVLGCWRVPLGFNLHLCWELLVVELTLIEKSRIVVEA